MAKDRKFEKGQAITEMVIGLIAIMTVFLGLLFMATVGIANIETMLDARSQADQDAYNGTVDPQGISIREWNYGSDEIYFTADDAPVTYFGGLTAGYGDILSGTDTNGN